MPAYCRKARLSIPQHLIISVGDHTTFACFGSCGASGRSPDGRLPQNLVDIGGIAHPPTGMKAGPAMVSELHWLSAELRAMQAVLQRVWPLEFRSLAIA